MGTLFERSQPRGHQLKVLLPLVSQAVLCVRACFGCVSFSVVRRSCNAFQASAFQGSMSDVLGLVSVGLPRAIHRPCNASQASARLLWVLRFGLCGPWFL